MLAVVLSVFVFVKLAVSAQTQNNMSTSLHLLKNIVNYVVFFVLLSEIYSKQWMNENLAKSTSFFNYVNVLRWVYRIPLNALDHQCYPTTDFSPVFQERKQVAEVIKLTAQNTTSL